MSGKHLFYVTVNKAHMKQNKLETFAHKTRRSLILRQGGGLHAAGRRLWEDSPSALVHIKKLSSDRSLF